MGAKRKKHQRQHGRPVVIPSKGPGFFRDAESFVILKRKAFAEIVQRRSGNEPVRIWIPNCATGEEAYSVAIAFMEFCESQSKRIPILIFASDPDTDAVMHARRGVYSKKIIRHVSPQRLMRFFVRTGEGYAVGKAIRELCVFASQNLLTDPPFVQMDLSVCRTRLRDLNASARKMAMFALHYSLKPSGFLMLDAEETPGPFANLFRVEDEKHKLFTKISALKFPLADAVLKTWPPTKQSQAELMRELGLTQEHLRSVARGLAMDVNNDLMNLLSNVQIPMVMLSHDLRVRQFTPMAERLLNISAADVGRPVTELKLKVKVPQLALLLRQAMERLESKEVDVQDPTGRWYSFRIRPYKNFENRVAGAVIAMVDIHELKQDRRRAEALLDESETRFRIMADSAPLPIWVKGANTGGNFSNKAAHDVFGDMDENTAGYVWQEYLHPEDKGHFMDAYLKAFDARAPFRHQGRLRNKEGEYRWYDSLGTPRFSSSGEFLGYVGAGMDITEAKRTELHGKFINDLDLDFSQISGEDESICLLTNRLGEYLNVNRCFLCEIKNTGETVVVRENWQGWLRGVPSVAGEYRVSDYYTAETRRSLEQGRTTIINDVLTDPRTTNFAEPYLRSGVRAVVSVPIPGDGGWEFVLAAAQSEPRQWRSDEVQLMHDVATRLWLTVKRARALNELRESESRARRTLADQMVAGVAECDASGKFKMVNQRYCDITGRTKDELFEMRISDITHPDDWPRNADLFRRLFETGESFFIQKRYLRKDGAEIWVTTHVSGIRNVQGKVQESVSVVIDVTDRLRAEQELAAAKDRLAADLEAMTRLQKISGTFVRDGGLAAAAEIVDAAVVVSRAEKGDMRLFDSTVNKFDVVAERDLEAVFVDFLDEDQPNPQYIGDLKRGGRVIIEDVARSPFLQDPAERDAYLNAGVQALQSTPVLSRSGKLLAVLETYYGHACRPDAGALQPLDLLAQQAADIIERTQAESDLRAAYEHAEAATRAKDEFLAVVSHELRSPLTSILGYARLLRADTVDGEQIKHFVDVIERNGKVQLQLIEDLLDTARIITGKLRLEVQPLDLVGVISAALDLVRPTAHAKGIELHESVDALAGQITGDPERLQQVVWNLLSNAIKFTAPGGRVEIRLQRADRYVQIVVRDTGKGIDPDFLPHVFERFRQSDMSSTRRVGGLGLGLSLVKYLVELHGGSVFANNADPGAMFTVCLPLRAVYTSSKQEALTTLLRNEVKSLKGVRALVVDDEQEVRTLLTLTLEQYGANTEAVSSGNEALEALTSRQPGEQFHVLICDIGMPDEDGYTVMRKVRALPAEKGGAVPAIALTGYSSVQHRMRALEAGFQTYAVKPVDPDELVVGIKSLIRDVDSKAG